MAINTIRNNTGKQLELWNAGVRLADLNNGEAIQVVPIAIYSVTRGGVGYHNRHGVFWDGDSYSATYIAVQGTVLFTGNNGNVSFT